MKQFREGVIQNGDGNYKNLNFEIHIIHNAFPGKTFERKCKESGQGKQKFDIVFFNFVS
jgi:hypothetical protein